MSPPARKSVIVGPANAPRIALEAAVSRKLAYVMGKKKARA